ncbi:MAG: hypothetical protein WC045_04275 [Patescibacteria group bacterium]
MKLLTHLTNIWKKFLHVFFSPVQTGIFAAMVVAFPGSGGGGSSPSTSKEQDEPQAQSMHYAPIPQLEVEETFESQADQMSERQPIQMAFTNEDRQIGKPGKRAVRRQKAKENASIPYYVQYIREKNGKVEICFASKKQTRRKMSVV